MTYATSKAGCTLRVEYRLKSSDKVVDVLLTDSITDAEIARECELIADKYSVDLSDVGVTIMLKKGDES